MTDRELLELAAKAAGYVLGKHTQKDWAFTYGGVEWNPLTDDGDALRLAVKLGISVSYDRLDQGVDQRRVFAVRMVVPAIVNTFIAQRQLQRTGWARGVELEHLGNDPLAATRRAIVRAAAELGRSMT